MQVEQPANLEHALNLLAEHGGALTPIAGGTDLMVSWHHRPHEGLHYLDLGRVDALRGITLTNASLRLGARATYWEVIQRRDLRAEFGMLRRAALDVGAVQIQARGTWAGNIGNGSPAADGVPVMMAYEAEVELASASRGARRVRLDEYWTGYKQSARQPDELIVAIHLPRRKRTWEYWHKVGSRAAQAITKVGVAAVVDAAGWRVCVNSAAPYVKRCRSLEAALDAGDRPATVAELNELLARDLSPIDDIRSTGRYRLWALGRVLFAALA